MIDPFEPNPWKDFKAEDQAPKPPTRFEMAIGHLCALIFLLIVSLGIGFAIMLNGMRHGPVERYTDEEFKWSLAVTVVLSLAWGFGMWATGVWRERRTRLHLERRAREVEEHQREWEEKESPFARLMDKRLSEEARRAEEERKRAERAKSQRGNAPRG